MCNRYRQSRHLKSLGESFDANFDELDAYPVPSFNIAPTQKIVTIQTEKERRKLSFMRWDMHGHFNSRSERVTTVPIFSDAFVSGRRCLIPADAFYEWKAMGTIKQPYCFEVGNGESFA